MDETTRSFGGAKPPETATPQLKARRGPIIDTASPELGMLGSSQSGSDPFATPLYWSRRTNSHESGGHEMRSQLIPDEIPKSQIVYVLTTAEGRDKVMKFAQYVLKSVVWLINVPDVLPFSDATDARWTQRLCFNILTIRNGRSLFKLGRWITTLFNVIDLMKLLRTTDGKGSGTTSGGSFRRAKPVLNSEQRTMLYLIVFRNFASLVRNLLRDMLFLSGKELFGIRFQRPFHKVAPRVANRLWLIMASIDFVLNLWRLANPDWLKPMRAGRCNCHVTDSMHLEDVNLASGCPSPTSERFVQARVPNQFHMQCDTCRFVSSVENMPERGPHPAQSAFIPSTILRAMRIQWLFHAHPNWAHVVMLQTKYASDVYLAFNYAFMSLHIDDAHHVSNHTHLGANLAGLVTSTVSILRVYIAGGL